MSPLRPLALLLLPSLAPAQTPTVAPGWPVTVPGASVGGGALVDLDGDPELELVVASGTAGGTGYLHAFDPDGSALAGWPAVVEDGTFAAPCIGDIDGDGAPEVVATTFFFGIGGDLVAYEADGSPVPGFPVSFGGPLKGAALADLDGDGDLEIVVGFNSGGFGNLYALQGDGSVLAGWPRVHDDVLGAAPAVGDVDGDGVPEIFGPSYNSLFGYRPDGSDLPGFPFTPPNQFISYSTPSLADLDGDGQREIVFGTQDQFVDNPGRVWVLEPDGSVAAGWPRNTSSSVYAPPAVVDLDRDGVLDVVIGDQLLSPNPQNRLYAWDASGSPLPGFPVLGLDAVTSQVTVADVDGDGELEILHETNVNGQGYQARNHDGTPVAGWPLDAPGSSFNAQLSVGDADGDGLLDIAGTFGRVNDGETDVYLWNTTAPWSPALAPLPTHLYGPARDAVATEFGPVGTPFCTSTANSTGAPARISASGSTSVLTNLLTLAADPVPAQPGLFYYGPDQLLLPFGNGFRCVGGIVGRLPVALPTAGRLLWELDLTQPPSAATLITPGSTWNFQAWYRDPAAGGAAFDLSDGLSVTFAP